MSRRDLDQAPDEFEEVRMSQFLHGTALSAAIRSLAEGEEVRFAVAFWGEGAAALFAEAPPPGARLICEATSGGTNPAELVRLGALDNPNLRHVRGLHAKVYLSDKGAVVTSANASANGIGFSSDAALSEAGTLHLPGEETFARACEWFEDLWEVSRPIDAGALEQARAAFEPAVRNPVSPPAASDPASLLDAVLADPGRFRGVGFALTSGNATLEQRDETARAVISEDDARRTGLLSREVRRTIVSWPVGDVFSEWDPQDVSAWPRRFVCVHRNGRGRIGYWFYHRAHVAILDHGRGMVLAERVRGLRRELGFPHGREAMAETDQSRLEALFQAVDETGHRLFESGESLAAFVAGIAPRR